MSIDIENQNNSAVLNQFIYKDSRCFTKISILFKIIQCIFYTITLKSCNIYSFYYIIIISLFLSILNEVRYEYNHWKRYTFSSLDDFELWKKTLYPQSKIIFSAIDFIIKSIYFIHYIENLGKFDFSFKDTCSFGESVFKINIMINFGIYFIMGAFSCIILTHYYYRTQYNSIIHRPIEVVNIHNLIIPNQSLNEECSICMDLENNNTWIKLSCGHKFHSSCITQWLNTHQTCPICRHNVGFI